MKTKIIINRFTTILYIFSILQILASLSSNNTEMMSREKFIKHEHQAIEYIWGKPNLLERGLKDFASGLFISASGLSGSAAHLMHSYKIRSIQDALEQNAENFIPTNPKYMDKLIIGFGYTAIFFIPDIKIENVNIIYYLGIIYGIILAGLSFTIRNEKQRRAAFGVVILGSIAVIINIIGPIITGAPSGNLILSLITIWVGMQLIKIKKVSGG